ncbi:alpha/beta hydrolase [Curtobacterium sp. RRHDQ10]|uniref:alpha/beta hydrolase n=1 Tax=Curtobacterium phyllosphaerae TaxID=3413379 RepID=UPI003BF2905B
MAPALSRRTLLVAAASTAAVLGAGAAGAAGVETGVLPGRSRLHRALGLDGPAGVVPSDAAGPFASGSFVSAARLGRSVSWGVSYPPGSRDDASLPVVVVLHGYGETHADAFGTRLGLDRFLAAAVAAGSRPFAIAAVDGGNTYWHARRSGEDAGRMVTEEFLPVLADRGLRSRPADRVGFLGWSMGGFGALLLGSTLGRERVAAVGGMSVALWLSADRTASGAFDGPADFAAHDLYRRGALLGRVPVRVDCGTGDGFAANDRALVASIRAGSGSAPGSGSGSGSGSAGGAGPIGAFEPGGHDMAYWRRVAPAQLRFLAAHLS